MFINMINIIFFFTINCKFLQFTDNLAY